MTLVSRYNKNRILCIFVIFFPAGCPAGRYGFSDPDIEMERRCMKRALKILIPLILILALLVGAGWYFGFYNRPLTVDILLSFSARMDTARFSSLSKSAYNLAYKMSDQDPSIAINLASSYRKQGNFTKAEYTLVNAISQNPSVDLYLALSQTYVAQDKLLDASKLLDKISDPDIKAQLEDMRPTAPTAQPEPGFYNNYVDVTLSGGEGTLYYTTEADYPSLNGDVYEGPITLSAGETTISALVVGENGLVSSRSVFGYTVDGVIENVTLLDSALDSYVRELLGKNADVPLRSDELWSLTELEVPEEVKDFSDLTRFTGLTSLTIQNQTSLDLSFLSGMTKLQKLDLTGCRPSRQDLGFIAALPSLTELDLSDCGLSGIDPLKDAAALTVLDLSNNSIRNISALESMTKLQKLNLAHNALVDLDSLSGLTELTELDLSYNSISDIGPLATCQKITTLDISENHVSSLAALTGFTQLNTLTAEHNAVTSVSPLTGCTALETLVLSNNQLTDISDLAALTGLRNLDISYNGVTALPIFPADSALYEVLASYNSITDISGLENLSGLSQVDLDYNADLEDISALNSCYTLAQLNAYGTKVTDVATLKERDVIVNYNPLANS